MSRRHPRTRRPRPDGLHSEPGTLRVAAADDHAEHDADRRADEALHWLAAQEPAPHAPVPAGAVRRRHAPHPDGAIGAEGGTLDTRTERQIRSSTGTPLAAPVRRSMEAAFGADLGHVRVHHGAQADRLSRSMSAQAFTTGRDIFFSEGAYAPDSAQGRHVLAHELGHVLQGGGAVRRLLSISARDLDAVGTSGPRAMTSSFSKIREGVADVWRAKTPEKRMQFMHKLNNLCLDYLNTHQRSDDPKDAERRRLVDALVDQLTAELAQGSQDQAQADYLQAASGKATGAKERFNLKAITNGSRNIAARESFNPDLEAAKSAGLSKAEYSAISTFTGMDYRYINPASANSESWMGITAKNARASRSEVERNMFAHDTPTLVEEGTLHSGVAMQGLERMPEYTGTVYRGQPMDDKQLVDLRRSKKWSSPSLSSATKSQGVAEGFAVQNTQGKNNRVIFAIEDSGGRDIESFSQVKSEKEVLLLAGSQYAVTKVERMDTPTHYAKGLASDGTVPRWWIVRLTSTKKGARAPEKAPAPSRPARPAPKLPG
ncbi:MULTISPECIES: eCIS core domain-containing protein [unclassified Nocardioides]|uniref:eCIS core domain-containing protein n=1 Tax=unclassified Nocardioides TaxID=2615069 RepID=UPI003014C7D3